MKTHPPSKKLLRQLTAAALSALLVAGTVQPLTAYAAEIGAQVVSEEAQGQLETKTLDTIKYNPQWENASKVKKGNTHECSHLGFYIPAGVTFKIRQTNKNWTTNMTFRLRNDDNKTQEILTLNANGDWLEVTPKYDSVPTISSHYNANGEQPVIEYTIEGTKEIPVYQYGGDEAAFYAKWDELDAPFAIFQSTYTQWLVPARDKTSNTAGTLDDLLLYYDNMIRFYNEFSGLSTEEGTEVWNRDSETRYFIKPGANGWGAAYYHVMETAPNSNSVASYMQNSGGWMPLHEVAHGYDTMNFDAVDIWNNVLSHYYQTRVLGKSIWLNPTEENRAKFEADREKYGYWGDSQYSTKLYFWVNMLDKTGPQKTSAYAYQLYRKNVYNGVANISGHSFYADAYTRGSGFNVTPWMELWGFTITDEVKLSLIEEECFENIYPLWNLVKSDETAKTIQEALGLESMYSMVETSELVDYNKSAATKVEGTLTVKLDDLTYSVIKDTEIRITDGKTQVTTVKVTGKEMDVTLPVGVYNIYVPGPGVNDKVLLHNDMNYAVITEGETTTHEVTATQIAGTDEFVDWTITIGSTYTYQGTYFTATTDLANGTIQLATKNCNPHSNYGSQTFSSIIIRDADGNEVYSKIHTGSGTTAEEATVDIEEGYTITVYHREPQRGCKVYSSAVNSVMLLNNDTSAREWKFEVTENGLARISPAPASTGEENYYSVVCAYMDDLKKSYDRLDFQTPGKLSNQKVKVSEAYAKLTEAQKTEFATKYDGYYPFDQGVKSLTIAAISEQSYTGSAITPTLTVTANSTTLTDGQYRTEWFANTDVGTAKVKVYGLDAYKDFSGEATFAIVQPTSLSRTLDVTLQYTTVQFTGGYKYPEVEVKTNGKTLTRSVDYVIVYENNLDVGTATVTAKGMGNYAGFTGTATFQITKRIQTLTVSFDPGKVNYTGEAITLPDAVTVWDVRNKLTEGKDYTLTYSNNTDIGKATVTATGMGNFEGCSGVGTFEITAPVTPQPTGGTVFSNWKYSMEGYEYYGRNYLKLDINVKDGTMGVVYNGSRPHGSFGTNIYASVSVFDTNNSRSFYKEIQGGVNGTAMDEQVPIGLGYVIELYFAEPTKNQSKSYSGEVESVTMTPKSARYLVTAQGLQEITGDGKASTTDPASQYDTVLWAYMDKLKDTYEKADFTDEEKFPTEKETVEAGLLLLTADQLAKFKEDYAGYYPFNIPKEVPTVTAPVANTLTYNGEAQTLVSAGSTTAGTLEYKLGVDGAYGTALPTATNAGDYTVYYRVVGNKDVADVAEQSVSVTIQRAAVTLTVNRKAIQTGDALPDLTAPVLGTDYTVSGLVGGDTLNGTLRLEYQKDGKQVTPDTAQEGTYDIVALGVTEPVGGNYNALVVNNGTLTISAVPLVTPTVTAPVANTLTYNGEAQTLVSAGSTTAGTLEYKLGVDGTYGTALPAATNAGDYTVYYHVVGGTGVADVAEQFVSVTIQRAAVTLTVKNKAIQTGDALPNLTAPVLGTDYTVSGLVGGDTLNGTLRLEYQKDGKQVTPDTAQEGTYDIVALGVTEPAGGNYNALVVNNGTLTVSSRSYSAPVYYIRSGKYANGAVSLSTAYARKGRTVTLTVKPDEGYELATLSVLDKDGNPVTLTDAGNGTYTFTMPAGKVTVDATFEEIKPEAPAMDFEDVTEQDYFHDAVQWAVKNKITEGIGENRFGAELSCTRAQMVVFLWRMAGCPEPQTADNPFSDLKQDAYYYKAVLWAMQNGITNGISATEFAPELTVTRAQVAALLHRASGAVSSGTDSGFTDVSDSAYYAAAVAWAAEQGITGGVGGGLFAPNDDCTRAQIVTMLYRSQTK